ncbi:hypothetical protein ACO1O0_000294 [Amphichorda felina]
MTSRANTNISPSKQTRIDIWRSEVAALTTPPSPATPTSSTSAATITTSSSSSSTYSHPFQHHKDKDKDKDHHHQHQRRRSLWRRLARRISGRGPPGGGGGGDNDDDGRRPIGEDVWDQDMRTDMYRDVAVERPVVAAEEGGANNAQDALFGEDEDDARGRGLKQKQERLERAARLLNQGVARDGERP